MGILLVVVVSIMVAAELLAERGCPETSARPPPPRVREPQKLSGGWIFGRHERSD
jgi:hypothetical protein